MKTSRRCPVFVVLAVFRPEPTFLEAQLRSLAAQTYPIERIVAVIADCASRALVEETCDALGLPLDLVMPEETLVSYRSFEAGLARVVDIAPDGAVIALSDQDDVWRADKIERSLAALLTDGAALVHSDAEVIDGQGARVHRSLARLEGRKRNASLRDLLIRNTVTGMTVVMTRDVAKAALPFPPQAALFFHHDLWIALVASMLGPVAYVDAPLVGYRQHGGNVVGAVSRRRRGPRIGSDGWRRHWVGRYGVAAYLAKSLYLRASELAAGDAMTPDRAKLAALAPYLSPTATGAALLLDAGRLGALGHIRLAADSVMHAAVQVGRLLVAALPRKADTMAALGEFDRKLFALAPGAQPGTAATLQETTGEVWSAERFADRRTVRRFDVAFSHGGAARAVILVPTLNPQEIFAGIATALDIGVGLAERGHEVIFVATDIPIGCKARSEEFIRRRGSGDPACWSHRITVSCAQQDGTLRFGAEDSLVATAWWTAHVAQGLIADHPFARRDFYYLIQDYEPGFYPWGHEYAGALASYGFDYIPIFNSEPLRAHFELLDLLPSGRPTLTFHPSIDLTRYMSVPRAPNRVPRLAVYGRPEVARNLFEVCVGSLDRFLAESGVASDEVELVSVGMAHPDVVFSGGHRMKSLGKIPWDAYPAFLGTVDIGLSLMLSPHPSHLPLELAAAGARVVTNGFGAKDLGRLSPAILSVPPAEHEVASALVRAWTAGPVTLAERRIDISALGGPLADVVDAISEQIGRAAPKLAKTA